MKTDLKKYAKHLDAGLEVGYQELMQQLQATIRNLEFTFLLYHSWCGLHQGHHIVQSGCFHPSLNPLSREKKRKR